MGNTLGLGLGVGLGLGLCAGAGAVMQAAAPNMEHLKRNTEALVTKVVTSRHQNNTEDIDESSAEGLRDAMSYAKENPMLIQVPVLGTARKFWRLSDKATRISRKLALILWNYHKAGRYLTAPLKVSNVWIGSTGSVKLRGASFSPKGFISIERVRDDYKHLSKVLILLIKTSGGDIDNLPPDYWEFLMLLGRGTFTMKDEFFIVNHVALLPMENRYFFLLSFIVFNLLPQSHFVTCVHSTEVFLMLHDRIVNYLGRTDRAKKKKILCNLPYKDNWLDTARANEVINKGVVKVQNEYRRTPIDLLRLNRNVRCHMHQYNSNNIEETLYCEWPELLMVMENMLHLVGELVDTGIENKFG
jgi:hypothetical protein